MDNCCSSSANPDGFEVVLQTSPTGRSTCYSCEETIQLGSVRFGIWSTYDKQRWLKIWKFRHVDCVATSEIEQALAEYDTVEGIPTLIKQSLGGISRERREECNALLSCALNGEPQPEEVVQRLRANPDQHVWDLLEDAKSRRIRTPGSKKQDKFEAAKAAIESARDDATGHFDVNEALAILTSKKAKTKPRAQIKGGKGAGKGEKGAGKRSRKRKADVTDNNPGKRSSKKTKTAKKTIEAKKAKRKGGSTNTGDTQPSPKAGGGGNGGGSVKEEGAEGAAVISQGSTSAGGGGGGGGADAAMATNVGVKEEAASSSSSFVLDSAYTGPRTRSRSKRGRS